MKKRLLFVFQTIVLLQISACSEPFSFDLPESEIEIVDAKVSNIEGNSYVDVYKMDGGVRESMIDLSVSIISSSGNTYEFEYSETHNLYKPIDDGFKGEVGLGYRLEASDSDRTIFTSGYDTIPQPIDFDILLKEISSSVFFEETNVFVEKRATTVTAQIPLANKKIYLKGNFKYQVEYFFSLGDSLEYSDPTQYTLYESVDIINDEQISIRLGEKLIDKWFVFVNFGDSCQIGPAFYTGDIIPVSCGCCHWEEFWPMTFEISMESLSKSTYDYWQNVEKLSKNDGLIFDTYPFPLIGNISCNNCNDQVLGSFRAVSETTRKQDLK